MTLDEDDFAEIEARICDLRDQYPNSVESVKLHARLTHYKLDPAYQERFRTAMSMLLTVGFKAGRRSDGYY